MGGPLRNQERVVGRDYTIVIDWTLKVYLNPSTSLYREKVMKNKKTISSLTGLLLVGVLSYMAYRSIKKLDDIDFIGENLHDEYYFKKNHSRS